MKINCFAVSNTDLGLEDGYLADVILTSERLRIVPFEEADFPLLLELHSDPQVNRYLSPGLMPMEASEVERRLQCYVLEHRRSGLSKWKVLTREGNFIGRAGVTRMTDPNGYELGYSLKCEEWGRGYATEIARALTGWYFENTGNRYLIAYAHSEHAKSLQVMRKAGFAFWFEKDKHGVPCTFYRIERHEVT